MAVHLRRLLRELRENARYRLGRALARILRPRSASARLDPGAIQTVLICRINARMGNTLFLTPLLKRLGELLPNARIDVASAYPLAAELIGPLPGVRRIICFPYKGVQLPWRYLAAIVQLRRARFDLAIDPAPNSTSGRVALMLAHTRWRLGYASDNQWAPLTHAVTLPRTTLHQAAQPVYLLSQALGTPLDPDAVRLWLGLTQAELETGRALVAQALAARGHAETSAAFGFFAHATGFKQIPAEYWKGFWHAFLELEPEAVPLEFLPSPGSAPVERRSVALHIREPRALAAAIAATRMFVSADAGPMHLASSTAVPTVALFRASDPALYGPLKPCDRALDATRLAPKELAEQCRALWRSRFAGTKASAPK